MYSNNIGSQVHLYLKLCKGSQMNINKMASVIGVSVDEVVDSLVNLHLDGTIKLKIPNRLRFESISHEDEDMQEYAPEHTDPILDAELTDQAPDEPISPELPADETIADLSGDDLDFGSESFMDEEHF